jgi:peptidoglycan endopeptidase LytF
MTRRDIIMIAVLANIGVLSILFMLAFRSEERSEAPSDVAYQITEEHSTLSLAPSSIPIEIHPEPIDEVDVALEELTPLLTETQRREERYSYTETNNPPIIDKPTPEPEPVVEPNSNEKYVEVTIKRGDALEKIARGNGTSIKALMEANHMTSDRLKIGQVLRIPVSPSHQTPTAIANTSPAPSSLEAYYTIKSGDNPWKIAKQFQMSPDQLLKLNGLDEDNARRLKVGDRIRVK